MSDEPAKAADTKPADAKPPADKPAENKPAEPAVKADPALTRADRDFKHGQPLFGCRIDPSGRYVFAGAQDNLVQRFDLESGKTTALAGHESWVRAIACSPDGKTLVTGGYDGRIIFWDPSAEQPTPLRKIDAHHGWVRSLSISADGKLLASGGNDNLVKLWNLADGSPVRELSGHATHVYFVLFHPGGQALVSGDQKGIVKHWDVSTGSSPRELTAPMLVKYDNTFGADIGGTRSMAFSADGKWLAASGIANVSNAFAGIGNPLVALFDWESGQLKQQLVTKDALKGVGWGVHFHGDGFLIGAVGGGSGGHLVYWKTDAPNEFFKFKLPANARDVDLHPDGLRIAVAQQNGQLGIYSMTAKPKA